MNEDDEREERPSPVGRGDGEAGGKTSALVHEVPAMFDQQDQLSCPGIIGAPDPQAVAVAAQPLQPEVGVLGIALGPTAGKGLAVVGGHLGGMGQRRRKSYFIRA